MITFEVSGTRNKTETFLAGLLKKDPYSVLHRYGREGVAALESATPIDSSLTAQSWRYEVTRNRRGAELAFYNDNIVDGQPIAVLIQYGHGTGTGGYVEGIDYINPALRPIFDRIVDEVWKEVISA